MFQEVHEPWDKAAVARPFLWKHSEGFPTRRWGHFWEEGMPSLHHLDRRQWKKKGETQSDLRLSGVAAGQGRQANQACRGRFGREGRACVWRAPDTGAAGGTCTRFWAIWQQQHMYFISQEGWFFKKTTNTPFHTLLQADCWSFIAELLKLFLAMALGVCDLRALACFLLPWRGTQIISGHSCRSVVVTDPLEKSREVAESLLLHFLFHFMTSDSSALFLWLDLSSWHFPTMLHYLQASASCILKQNYLIF